METEPIKQIIREFLEKLSVTVEDIAVHSESVHPLFEVKTADSRLLIGAGGENLRALNVVIRRIVERRLSPEKAERLLIDVNGYHGRRIAEIRNHAKMLAERARVFKYDVEMSPMNAYERMIVHAAFGDDPDIVTESTGEGKVRHVVLRYRPKAERVGESI
jgi:spoIIIJ-associated protein